MKDFPIAIQLYSLRDEMAADFEGTLKKVKELGYDGVEFAGLHGKSAAEVKALCEKYDLVPISAHVPIFEMYKEEDCLKTYKEIGCEFVVIPWLGAEHRPGTPGFEQVIEVSKVLVERCAELGLTLCYHNHDFEFTKVGDEYALDMLYREVKGLNPQFDTCWVNVGGENPADYIRKYADQVEIIHLKDFVGKRSENMYALIGVDDGEEKKTSGEFELRPLGHGVQNFPEILDAARDVNAKWVVVEQDLPSMGKTPLECAEISINYLKSL